MWSCDRANSCRMQRGFAFDRIANLSEQIPPRFGAFGSFRLLVESHVGLACPNRNPRFPSRTPGFSNQPQSRPGRANGGDSPSRSGRARVPRITAGPTASPLDYVNLLFIVIWGATKSDRFHTSLERSSVRSECYKVDESTSYLSRLLSREQKWW